MPYNDRAIRPVGSVSAVRPTAKRTLSSYRVRAAVEARCAARVGVLVDSKQRRSTLRHSLSLRDTLGGFREGKPPL
jgi:hypothetical protein